MSSRLSRAKAAKILWRRRKTRRRFSRWARLYGVEPAPHHRLLMSRLMPALGLNVPPTVLERADH